MNVVILQGRLTDDPKVWYGNEGNSVSVARYTLAVDRYHKKEGEDTADFIHCVTFIKGAAFAAKYLKKGMKITIRGSIQTGNYTNRDGVKVGTTEVVVSEHAFCESKQSSAAAYNNNQQNLILLYQVLAFSYAHILRAYIADQKKLEEKAPILEEIFNQDVKEFLYQQVSYFTTDQIHLLFESGYLDFSEFMRINKKYSKEYLKKMDKPYLLTFLKTFCESRNWIFTDNEANFLENSFKDSWVIGLAYYKKQTVNYLSVFSEEEQEMLLGLMCELITRIPDICDLDDFMAGIISSTETRKILGAELSEQWYQFLEARSYKAMNSLRQDYLPEEVYAAFVQKKEKLEAEKKKIKEQEKLKEAKAALNDELNEISDTVEGNLYGHLYLGAIMVKEACRACMVNETSQNIQLLIHMILSHHGKMEYGAVKSPATREAYVLHILDELDSKLWVYEDVMKNTEPGTFSQPNRWLDGAVVYNSDVDLNSH